MSAPARIRRSGPRQEAAPTKTTDSNSSGHTDELALDRLLVGDASIWAELFDGKFRLAVKSDVCGRWLVSHKSKAAGRGPSCAARAAKG